MPRTQTPNFITMDTPSHTCSNVKSIHNIKKWWENIYLDGNVLSLHARIQGFPWLWSPTTAVSLNPILNQKYFSCKEKTFRSLTKSRAFHPIYWVCINDFRWYLIFVDFLQRLFSIMKYCYHFKCQMTRLVVTVHRSAPGMAQKSIKHLCIKPSLIMFVCGSPLLTVDRKVSIFLLPKEKSCLDSYSK